MATPTWGEKPKNEGGREMAQIWNNVFDLFHEMIVMLDLNG